VERGQLALLPLLNFGLAGADTPAMRHARLWLILIGAASIVAQAIAAAAVLWRGSLRARG
jgi:hypothetical protein